ncbi:MAG: hypothetical protein WBF43_06795 [Methylocella sp.]
MKYLQQDFEVSGSSDKASDMGMPPTKMKLAGLMSDLKEGTFKV